MIGRVARAPVLIALGLGLLWGCGGGSSDPPSGTGDSAHVGGDGSPPAVEDNASNGSVQPIISFQIDSSVTATENLVFLKFNADASQGNVVIFDLMGLNLNSVAASGVSADLLFDSTQMTFMGFEKDPLGVDVGLAAPLESYPDIVVIGIYTLKESSGRLGTLRFILDPKARASALGFTKLMYIGSDGNLLSTPEMAGRGGALNV